MARPTGGYYAADGKRVPGVTTVISSRQATGGLMWWANRLAYDPLMEARALMANAIKASDPIADAKSIDAIQAFLNVDPAFYDHNATVGVAATAGTITHSLVESHLQGKKNLSAYDRTLNSDIANKADTAFLGFLEWAESSQLKVEEQELSLVSEDHRFGGTLDACVLSINGKRAIGDWKTSNATYGDHLVQVAAYGELYAENHPDKPIDGGYHIMRFDKEHGDFHHHFFQELNNGWNAFLLMRELYDVDKLLTKRAK